MSQLKESQHLQIPLEQIESGTNNFQDCVGKGGLGKVYKGQLVIFGKPTTVAVKRLSEQFGQGLKEFLTEVQLLTGQTHPNLISLIGYCDEGKEKIIVYEYAQRGSLDQYLRHSCDRSSSNLKWLEKVKICVGAARGLDYLHNHVGKHQTIIHRDIKSSNILIDENWVAKISDLGLSKLSLSGLNRSAIISHACGTLGYIEPEYMYTGIVKKESDVYSFGIVLFEVLCGRLCTDRDDDGFQLSGQLAKEYFENNRLDEIVDPNLKDQMSPLCKNKFSAIAYRCLHYDRGQRPSMDLVLKELEESLEIQLYHASEPSYALEDPYKSSGEMEAHVSKESAITSSEPPVIMPLDDQLDHASGASYALEDPYKNSGELGDHVSKEASIASSEPPLIMSLKKENQLQISTKMIPYEVANQSSSDLQSYTDINMSSSEPPLIMSSNKGNQLHTSSKMIPYEVANRSTVDLQSYVDITMQTQPNNETKELLDVNPEVLKVVLESKKHIWKHQQLFELVEEYFKGSHQTSNFCDALEKCLKRVQHIRMLIFTALNHFEEKRYENTLEDLRTLKAIGDPFTQDFFNIFLILYTQQTDLIKKLQQSKLNLNKRVKRVRVFNVIFLVTFAATLIFSVVMAVMVAPAATIATPATTTILLASIGIWIQSFMKKYRNTMKGEKEVISTMQMEAFVGIKDLDIIRVLVEKVVLNVENLTNTAEYVLIETVGDKEVVVVMKHGIEVMNRHLDSFLDGVESLKMHAANYARQSQRLRTLTLQRIIGTSYPY